MRRRSAAAAALDGLSARIDSGAAPCVDEPREARDEDRRLARSGGSEHEQRAAGMGDRARLSGA